MSTYWLLIATLVIIILILMYLRYSAVALLEDALDRAEDEVNIDSIRAALHVDDREINGEVRVRSTDFGELK